MPAYKVQVLLILKGYGVNTHHKCAHAFAAFCKAHAGQYAPNLVRCYVERSVTGF
jgi:hypothetical protein